MPEKEYMQSNYRLITAELSALYEIPSLSFAENEKAFINDMLEKATRLFDIRFLALYEGPRDQRQLLVSWGFRDPVAIPQRVADLQPSRFVMELYDGWNGLLFMEQAFPIKVRERRLLTVFARRVQTVMESLRENEKRRAIEEELEQYREHLQDLVRERTAELKDSNERLRTEIAERKQAEKERNRLLRDASDAKERELFERTNRLTSIGLLAAGVAHEVNNPLQGMLSHLNSIKRVLPDDFPKMESVWMLENGIQTISELVKKLLALTREPVNGRRETADSGDALDFVTRLLEHEFKRANIIILRREQSAHYKLQIGQRELVQVLLNLYINARDAMPDGGRLTVRTESDGRLCTITLADTGKGIPRKLLGQILSPFFTTKGSRGTGLGLSVAESILRHCGGSIDVESEPGKGSRFMMRIPLAKETEK